MSAIVLALLGALPAAHARDLGTPLPPLAVEAAAADGGVLVTWQPPADEGAAPVLAYHVHRLDGTTGAWDTVGSTEAAVRSFLDPDADAALAYAVSAANENGPSLRSAPAAARQPCSLLAEDLEPPNVVDWGCFWETVDGVAHPCTLVVIGGVPPQAAINWDCIPHPAVRIDPR